MQIRVLVILGLLKNWVLGFKGIGKSLALRDLAKFEDLKKIFVVSWRNLLSNCSGWNQYFNYFKGH